LRFGSRLRGSIGLPHGNTALISQDSFNLILQPGGGEFIVPGLAIAKTNRSPVCLLVYVDNPSRVTLVNNLDPNTLVRLGTFRYLGFDPGFLCLNLREVAKNGTVILVDVYRGYLPHPINTVTFGDGERCGCGPVLAADKFARALERRGK
jgi:hypothetical protein